MPSSIPGPFPTGDGADHTADLLDLLADARWNVVDDVPADYDRPTCVVHGGQPNPNGSRLDTGATGFGQQWLIVCVGNSRANVVELAWQVVGRLDGGWAGGTLKVTQVADPIFDDEAAGFWRWSATVFVET